MAIRLRLADGTDVESDSAQELVEFYHQLAGNGHKALTAPTAKRADKSTLKQQDQGEPIKENAAKLVRLLLAKQDGLTTSELAAHFNVEPRGIGGIIANLSTWAKRNGLRGKQDVLTKNRRTENGVKVRTLVLTKGFRDLLSQGKLASFREK